MRAIACPVVSVCVAAAVLGQTPPPTTSAAGEARTVTVSAEGFNRDDALHQALRAALEQGAGTEIAGYSQVENFALVRDTIYSRATGIVSEYEVLSAQEVAGGLWQVRVRAVVRPSAVAAAWGEVQNVLDQVGRPKIMVWIDEEIDGQLQRQSTVESRIEQLFVQAGFDLVAREAMQDLHARATDEAQRLQDAARLAQLAKDTGAHLLIRGYAHADPAGVEDLFGTPAAFYNCDVQAKVYATDTGELLASESLPVTRRGARSQRDFSPQAARAALVAATFPQSETRREPALAVRLYETVMRQWSTRISAGRDLLLEVAGLDFKAFLELKRKLAEIPRVQSVEGDFTAGLGRFRLKAHMQADTLAEHLLALSPLLEVTDLKPNRVQAELRSAAGVRTPGS